MIYLELLWVFGRIGAITFGGGYAMVSLFLREVVSRGWCRAADFANIVAVAQMTPGPIAMNTATYVGKMTAGIPGAITASAALVIAPLIYISILVKAASWLGQKSRLTPFIKGIRCAAVGFIGTAVLFFAENSLFTAEIPVQYDVIWEAGRWSSLGVRLPAVGIFLLIFALTKWAKWSPIAAIALSLGLGVGLFGVFPTLP